MGADYTSTVDVVDDKFRRADRLSGISNSSNSSVNDPHPSRQGVYLHALGVLDGGAVPYSLHGPAGEGSEDVFPVFLSDDIQRRSHTFLPSRNCDVHATVVHLHAGDAVIFEHKTAILDITPSLGQSYSNDVHWYTSDE